MSAPSPQPGAAHPRFRLATGSAGKRAAAAVLAVLATACADAEPVPAPAPRRNVLVIVIDTLRADRLGCYGNDAPTSPALDALAARSLLFETAYSQAPWTKPSVASIFTSLPSSQHLVLIEEPSNRLADALTTLPELFLEAGYRTAAVSENPHVQKETGFGQGFEVFHGKGGFSGRSTWVIQRAGEWLRELERDERFFLYLHFLDPHGPYEPADDLREAFLGERRTSSGPVRQGNVGKLASGGPLDASDLDYLMALYDAEIRDVDRSIGTLLDWLESEGKAEETIIVVTADHAEEFQEHGRLLHGYHLYDESVRVPLIFHLPGRSARRETDVIAQHIDIAPTLLDAAGLEQPSGYRGRSLAALARGEGVEQAPVLIETGWRDANRSALRTQQWKLIYDEVGGSFELYDVDADPGETRDLADERSDLTAQLGRTLAELQLAPDPAVIEGSVGEANEELMQRLRELGYLGR